MQRPLPSVRRRGRRWATAVVLAAALAATLPGPGALAAETDSFRLEPHPLQLQGAERRSFAFALDPGAAASDAVQLTNLTDEARRFRVYAADATQDAQGRVMVAEAVAPRTGVASWIAVERPEVALLPGSAEVVRFTVTRPQRTAAEGIGAIVAEEIRPAATGGGIQVVFRLATLVRLSGEASGVTVAAPRLTVPVDLVPSDGTVTAEVTNTTLQPVNATVVMTVESLTGRRWELEPVDVRLPPGATQTVERSWATVPRWGGALRVAADVTWEGGTVSARGQRVVVPPLWLVGLVIALVGVRSARELAPRARGPRRSPGWQPVSS
ncbi:MAG TPA: hypothetical protein VHF25_16860 [Nitriliruptorales bacterium]|nr:hypothetical protein [Nitriliruptorales bacterium]